MYGGRDHFKDFYNEGSNHSTIQGELRVKYDCIDIADDRWPVYVFF